MRREPARQIRPEGDDAGRVDAGVHLVVVPLDVVEVDGVTEPRRLVEVAGVRPQDLILRQLPAVALEVAVIDGVEADQRGEQPDVRLGDRVADQIALPRQPPGEQLEPPAADKAKIDELIERRKAVIDKLERAGKAAAAGDDKAFQSLSQEAFQEGDEVDAEARRYGFQVCGAEEED
jgi:hypothetical protein